MNNGEATQNTSSKRNSKLDLILEKLTVIDEVINKRLSEFKTDIERIFDEHIKNIYETLSDHEKRLSRLENESAAAQHALDSKTTVRNIIIGAVVLVISVSAAFTLVLWMAK